jgi:hypothetical protein
MLRMLDGLLTWTAHPEHQEVVGGSLLVQLCIEGVQLAFTWTPGSV